MGVYYLESDYVLEEGEYNKKRIQIEDDHFVITKVNQDRTLKIQTDKFWIGPGKVYVDFDSMIYAEEDLQNTVNKYIYRGCTLLICQLPITSTHFFKRHYKEFKERLRDLAIDYMIVPRVSPNMLKPELVKFFGSEKMPFILLDTDEIKDLNNVKWEWIQYTQHFSGIPLIPIDKDTKKQQKTLASTWKNICEKHRLNTLEEPITELPLTKETLRKTGISPLKGEFLHQGSADYNLFLMDNPPIIDEQQIFRYHKAIPDITVSKGKVIKINHLVETDDAIGELKQVTIPKHYI